MNKTLKWILYILLGVVGLLVLVGVVYAIFGNYRYGMMAPGLWMGDHMRFGFNPYRGVFIGLLCLGVLLLVVLGIVALVAALVRGNKPPESAPPAQITPPEKPCPNCGRITQEEWKTCPYCGTSLTEPTS